MKLAIIADIHGNIHALERVLEELEGDPPELVIVNGDLVNRGPNNIAVMERLMTSRFAFELRFTLGNHDDLVCKWADRSDSLPREWFEDPFWKATAWTTQRLAEGGWLGPLRNLPMTQRIELKGAPSLLISHGSPRHYREGYGGYLSDETLTEIIAHYPADILIGSHIHRPVERRVGEHLILNTGAVGTPFNRDARAQYLLLELQQGQWQITFCKLEYDQQAALRAFEESGFLQAGDLSAHIFYQEVRLSRGLFGPYWNWTEQEQQARNWRSWRTFFARQQGASPPCQAQRSAGNTPIS